MGGINPHYIVAGLCIPTIGSDRAPPAGWPGRALTHQTATLERPTLLSTVSLTVYPVRSDSVSLV